MQTPNIDIIYTSGFTPSIRENFASIPHLYKTENWPNDNISQFLYC